MLSKEEKEYLIEKIDEVLNSRNNKLSKTSVQKLTVVRERIKNATTQNGVFKLLEDLYKFLKGK